MCKGMFLLTVFGTRVGREDPATVQLPVCLIMLTLALAFAVRFSELMALPRESRLGLFASRGLHPPNSEVLVAFEQIRVFPLQRSQQQMHIPDESASAASFPLLSNVVVTPLSTSLCRVPFDPDKVKVASWVAFDFVSEVCPQVCVVHTRCPIGRPSPCMNSNRGDDRRKFCTMVCLLAPRRGERAVSGVPAARL